MKQLKIKDNSLVKKENFSKILGIAKSIADKSLEQLEREGLFVFPETVKDALDITRDQILLQSVNDMYRSGNVMGFIGLGDERLVIESRFSNGKDDYLFRYLLEKVMCFPNLVNLETDENQDNKLFSMLLFLFPRYLKSAMRKGVYKTYIRNEYNDGNVRGTVDVARHIRKNIPFVGNIAYNRREYSYDNCLMELIRHTIEYIKKKPYGNRILFPVKEEVDCVTQVTQNYSISDRRKVIEDNRKNVVRHAYYHEYGLLQHLCLLILMNQKHQIGSGTNRIYGILFDGAWLWEAYMNMLISDTFYHPLNKVGKDKQWLFADGNGLIYPDFISQDDTDRVIADAKYKPIDNIGNRDYLQILAYMFRFDARKAFFLYPEASEAEDVVLKLNSGSSYEKNVKARDDIRVIKHGLKIPQFAESYEEFVENIEISESSFTQGLHTTEGECI